MHTIYRLGTAVGATLAIFITANTFGGQAAFLNSSGQPVSSSSMPISPSTAIARIP
jgi:hypothetical protein